MNSYLSKIKSIWIIIVIFMAVFALRLFYVQVIQYSYYKNLALSYQLKQYQIPADRGIIEAYDNGNVVPIVLNQTFYTLYIDPTLVKNSSKTAADVVSVLGGSYSNYLKLIKTKNTRYVILSHKITQAQNTKLLAFRLPGLGTQSQDYRVYPDGSLASQLLGFVNNSGQGVYGIEQYLDKTLSGTPGRVKAVTDANGVPLAANSGNVDIAPKAGNNVVLTINVGIQTQLEQILKKDYTSTKSQGINALVMNPWNGQVVAMANYPTYDPSNYQNVSNPALFDNGTVTDAIEPGSIMKTLTTPAALDLGVIQPNTTFYDPAHWLVDGFNITDIEQDGGPRVQSISSILSLSLNTGATWMLMQMGGGQIDQKGIDAWYNYMTNHFRLGKLTGIEQGYESPGYIPPPNMNDPSIDLRYANTSFGQGLLLTPIQIASALSSVLNGGTYYQPTLVSEQITPQGKTIVNNPKILEKNVVSANVGPEMVPLLENVVKAYLQGGFSFMNFSNKYMVGGKTGTAQVAKPTGGYYNNIFNGTYIGFVGGDKIQYVIVVFNIKPNVAGYAGSYAGQPVFADIAHMLIDDGYVSPKS